MKINRLIFPLMFLLLLAAAVSAAEDKRFNVPAGDSPQKGPKDAPVTIIEFIDFQ